MPKGNLGDLQVVEVVYGHQLGIPLLPQEIERVADNIDLESFEILLLSFQEAEVQF